MATAPEVDLDGKGARMATPSLLATPSIPITLGNLRQYLQEIVTVGEPMPPVQVGARILGREEGGSFLVGHNRRVWARGAGRGTVRPSPGVPSV